MIDQLIRWGENLLEKDQLPDFVIRQGIRKKLQQKLLDERKEGLEFGQEKKIKLIQKLKASPIAVNVQDANDQHYELPPEFFQLCLGQHLKYSSAYWRDGVSDLSQAEADMLKITMERADLIDGQQILELGCGWGSLTLSMAAQFPNSHIIGVSNSSPQRIFIEKQAKIRNLKNIEIRTVDMNEFDAGKKFDRIVSVEMFEHMRNYQMLLNRISGWMKDDAKLFIHIFTHREFAYLYDEKDPNDWIGKYFFTGGVMPSEDLLLYFQDSVQIDHHWRVSGVHYQKTAEAWLNNMDNHKDKIWAIFKKTYGDDVLKWWVYWRVFYMACAELWGYKRGEEWMVSHYLFKKK